MKILLILLVALTAFVVSAEMKVQRTGQRAGTSKSGGLQAPEAITRIINRGQEALGDLVSTVKGERKPAVSTRHESELPEPPPPRGSDDAGSATSDHSSPLRNSLLALAEEGARLNPRLVNTLAEDLGTALSASALGKKRLSLLAGHLAKVVNAGSNSKSDVSAAIVEARALLVAGGVAGTETQQIVDDLKAIDSDARRHVTKTAASTSTPSSSSKSTAKTPVKTVARKAAPRKTTRKPAQVAMNIERE